VATLGTFLIKMGDCTLEHLVALAVSLVPVLQKDKLVT